MSSSSPTGSSIAEVRVIKQEIVTQIYFLGKVLVFRGCIVQEKSKPNRKGIIFELYDAPRVIIDVCWFGGGESEKFTPQEFEARCVVTGVRM